MDISRGSVFSLLCLTFLLLDAGHVAAQQIPSADSWLDEVIQPALRSLPRQKFDPKQKPRTKQPGSKPAATGKPRLGLKVQAGGGLALGIPDPGLGAGAHGALGFYFDHFAVMYALEVYAGGDDGFLGHFIELEIYDQSRRRSLDSYLIVGAGLGFKLDEGWDIEVNETRVLGPAAILGYGINLFGGEIEIPAIYGKGYPYLALHARFPVMAWVTAEGATASLVLEIAYQ